MLFANLNSNGELPSSVMETLFTLFAAVFGLNGLAVFFHLFVKPCLYSSPTTSDTNTDTFSITFSSTITPSTSDQAFNMLSITGPALSP